MVSKYKHNRILRVLSEASTPLSAQEIAKQTGSKQITARDAGLLLYYLAGEGKVRRISSTHGNKWELIR